MFFVANTALAIDVLFPQKNPYSTYSKTTYIMGNVKKGAKLLINGTPSKVRHNGAFCQTLNLKDGENAILLEEKSGNTITSKSFKITKIIPTNSPQKTTYVPPKKIKFKDLQYANITTDGAPVRSKPSTNGDRITHLQLDTVVLLDTKFGDWYKLYLGENQEELWVYYKNVKVIYPINNAMTVNIRESLAYEDDNFSYLKIALDLPIAYKTVEKDKNIELTLYGIKNYENLLQELNSQCIFQNAKIKDFKNNNLTIEIPYLSKLWGYDTEYENSALIFKQRKSPAITKSHPLKNVTIAIDAGHGGKELGTVGPTRRPEKDVNLAIALKLQNELIKQGANVVMTRTNDEFLGLYERPDIAKKNQALICLSIHANSMVDGDPYVKNGTSVFYYNDFSKDLADTLKLQLLEDLKLRDDGTRNSSFVLTRSTNPMSILIEVGYMPNPEEYEKLTNKHFQQKTANAIVKALKHYMVENTK